MNLESIFTKRTKFSSFSSIGTQVAGCDVNRTALSILLFCPTLLAIGSIAPPKALFWYGIIQLHALTAAGGDITYF